MGQETSVSPTAPIAKEEGLSYAIAPPTPITSPFKGAPGALHVLKSPCLKVIMD
jgi:hypothetical protein